MGKNHRHKKNLKSERAKVKLKGKTLPKGTNITNTTFKVRKIIIGEQLKNVGEKKVDIAIQIKDCLSKLRHHNHKACMGSLINLKSILSKSPSNMIDNQFGSILKNLAHLATNEERDVRRESFTVLLVLLQPIAEENAAGLIPYYDMLSSYLCCAMTHIDARIQNDSLLFLDVLLAVVPSIIINNYSKILDNFLDMISKLRTEAKPERTLTLNLSTRLTTIKWRVKVLQRLQHMLEVVIDTEDNEPALKNKYETNFTSRKSGQNIHIFDYNNPIYLGLRDYHDLKISDLGLFSGSKQDFTSPMNKENILEHKILTLMPLLYETWLEVKLNNTKNSYDCYILDADSATLLMSILEIMASLEILIRRNGNEKKGCADWFFKKYSNEFSSYVVDGFPYSEVPSNRKSNADVRNNLDCLKQNLYVCKMFLLFNADFKSKRRPQYELILKYIERNFLQIYDASKFPEDMHEITEDLLHKLFFQVGPKWCKVGLPLERILESLIELYETDANTNLKKSIFKLLCDISQDWKLKSFYDNVVYSEWLQSLASKLCKSKIAIDEVPYLCTLARQNNANFLQNMLLEFSNVLDVLTRNEDTEFIYSIIGILYYVPDLSSKNIDLVRNAIDNNCNIQDEDKKYLKTILNKL